MTTCRDRLIESASLHNIGNRSAVNLKIESDVPSKIRGPQNYQPPAGLSCVGGSDAAYANKTKNEKKCVGGAVSRLHGLTLASELALGEPAVHRLVNFSYSVRQAQLGLAGQPISHSAPGVKQTLDGRR